MPRPLDELIDIMPACTRCGAEPTLTSRGTVYAVFLAAGHSDFIAGSYAFNRPTWDGPADNWMGVEELKEHYRKFYDWVFPGDPEPAVEPVQLDLFALAA